MCAEGWLNLKGHCLLGIDYFLASRFAVVMLIDFQRRRMRNATKLIHDTIFHDTKSRSLLGGYKSKSS